MAITDKTRKILWAQSGNRCAICRCELVMPETSHDSDAIIGDECHIVSKQKGGPRHGSAKLGDYDDEGNLILLCRNHHKLIDDQPREFTRSKLLQIKSLHKKWVRDTLNMHKENSVKSTPFEFRLIQSAKELTTILRGAELFDFNNDELTTSEEVDLIGSFLQELQEYGDLAAELEAKQIIKQEYYLSELLTDLLTLGFVVYGTRIKKNMKAYNVTTDWIIASVRVVRLTNPYIQRNQPNDTKKD